MNQLCKVALIFIFPVILVSCSGHNETRDKLIRKVRVEQITPSDSLIKRSWPGTIKEVCKADLAFRVAGPIKDISIREGDYVRKGQLIARIDPRDYEIQLQVAKAQYDQVKAESERVIKLHEMKSVAGNDYDKAISGIRLVSAKLKNAEDQLNDTRLQAPFAGYVEKINFSEGEIVDAGMPIASLIDVSQFEVDVDIPVSFYVKRDKFLSFYGIQESVSKSEFPLQLTGFDKKADNHQLYEMKFRFDPGERSGLAPGMELEVNIVYKNHIDGSLDVPIEAVFNNNGEAYVWIYYPAGGVVKSRKVETGMLTGKGKIQIVRGLNPDETIVVAGVNLLVEGQQVELADPVSVTNVGGLL